MTDSSLGDSYHHDARSVITQAPTYTLVAMVVEVVTGALVLPLALGAALTLALWAAL